MKYLFLIFMVASILVGCGGGGGSGDGSNDLSPVVDNPVLNTIPTMDSQVLDDSVFLVENANDGGFYLMGQVVDQTTSAAALFIEKWSSTGEVLDHIDILFAVDPFDLVEVKENEVAILATVDDAQDATLKDIFITIVDFDNPDNIKIIDGLERTGDDLAASIRTVTEGGLLVIGTSGENWIRVLRLDSSYAVLWDITVNRENVVGVDALIDQGQLVVLGNAWEGTGSNFDIYLAKFDTTGFDSDSDLILPNPADETLYTGTKDDVALSIEKLVHGDGYLIVGSTNSVTSESTSYYDILALSTDKYNGSLDEFTYDSGGGKNDFSIFACKTISTEEGFIVVGATESSTDYDAALLVLNGAGEKTNFGIYGNVGTHELGLLARQIDSSTYQLAGLSGESFVFADPLFLEIEGDVFFNLRIDAESMQIID